MMTPSKAYCYYHGLHLHFGSEKYSILKYGAETKQAITKFKSLTAPQKYRFQWVSDKFNTTQDVVYATIASELNELDVRFADKQSILDSYFVFKANREALSYNLSAEFIKYQSGNEFKFHQLMFNYFAKQYSPEFVLLLDNKSDNLSKILNDNLFSFARPKILKLIKYKNFFSPTKYQYILNHEEPISV